MYQSDPDAALKLPSAGTLMPEAGFGNSAEWHDHEPYRVPGTSVEEIQYADNFLKDQQMLQSDAAGT